MKGLEALEEARNYTHMLITSGTWDNKISPNLNIVERELKALRVIKYKSVNVAIFEETKNLEEYNRIIHYFELHLTQEEYDLLKEVLL